MPRAGHIVCNERGQQAVYCAEHGENHCRLENDQQRIAGEGGHDELGKPRWDVPQHRHGAQAQTGNGTRDECREGAWQISPPLRGPPEHNR